MTRVKLSIEEEIAGRIDAALAKGTVPWVKPWVGGSQVARNLKTKHPYRGLNVLLLALSEHPGQWWVTYRQAEELGGHVLPRPDDLDKDAPWGTRLFFWTKWCPRHRKSYDLCKRLDHGDMRERDLRVIQKGFTVFNAVTQCEGLADRIPPTPVLTRDDTDACAIGLRMVDMLSIELPVREGGDTAAWSPMRDYILMPETSAFTSGRRYYMTALHELVHATGHADRLARDMTGEFGSTTYAREELTAEVGACIAALTLGFEPDVDQSAAYIDHWRRAIGDDPKLVTIAAQRASKAVEFMFGGLDTTDES